MHKDDVSVLDVKKVTVTSPESVEKAVNVPAIVRQLPGPEEHASALAKVIERKNKRIPDYKVGLRHVNLIVMDRFDRFWSTSSELRGEDLLIPALKSALFRTGFREMFFVTRVR
jgi:hypothetical protein